MEYAEGGTLDQYLKSNGAIKDTTKIKNIVKMIVEGLEQLHGGYKVFYQDLKPENIYFRDPNKTSLVLADFGISSVMEGYDEEVEVTASITDFYTAPELAHKGNRNELLDRKHRRRKDAKDVKERGRCCRTVILNFLSTIFPEDPFIRKPQRFLIFFIFFHFQ